MDHEKSIDTTVAHHESDTDVDSQQAHLANQEDHETNKLQAIKRNPWAFAWCFFAIWSVLLVSYENQASGTVLGIPQFRQDFGDYYQGTYVLSSAWQGAFSGGPQAAAIFGALGGAQLADWFGRKRMIMLCLVFSFVAITIEVISTTSSVFFAGKFINGLATGALATTCATYIGEIAPLALRGLCTCLIALAYTFGPFVVALIVNDTANTTTRWAYRSVFVSQYGIALVSAILVWFMPESPWWLVSRNREAEGLRSLQRLGYKNGEDAKRLAVVKLTLDQIRAETVGVTYFECFRKSNLRRTMISVAPLSIQALSGVAFAASYATYYMQLSGYSTAASFKLGIVQQVLSMLGNITSWFLVDRVGRRSLTIWGMISLLVVLMIMGGLAVVGTASALKGAVAMILLYCFLYNLTIGATAYNLLVETSTARLRVKTIALGFTFQNMLFVMWAFVLPYIFNPDKANLGGKTGFIFGGLSVLCIIYLWYCQVETAGRSYEELDELFMKRVPARKFRGYKTDAETKGQQVKRASISE